MSNPIPERMAPDVVDGVEVPRPLRICEVCKQIDDYPRHVVGVPQDTVPVDAGLVVEVSKRTDLTDDEKESIVAYLLDTTTDIRHMNCCATVGCPTGDCNKYAGIADGAALLAAIQSPTEV